MLATSSPARAPRGARALDEAAGKALLADFGIRVPKSLVVTDAAEAIDDTWRPHATFRREGRLARHSAQVGCRWRHAQCRWMRPASRARSPRWRRSPASPTSRSTGWLVEEMIPPGREIVIGGLNDPQFGPLIMVGLGGIFVEILKDVAFRICPIMRGGGWRHVGRAQGRGLARRRARRGSGSTSRRWSMSCSRSAAPTV